MLLAIDVGNTHVVTGVMNKKGDVLLSFRVASNEKMTEDEYFSYLRNIAEFNDIDLRNINGVIVSSVVPGLINIFKFLGKKYFKLETMVVDMELDIPFKFSEGMNPIGFGADRIIDITQAVTEYP
ncbi:MAG: type III pantothenate kinase, partial [Fusobacteriaceae bacterium]